MEGERIMKKCPDDERRELLLGNCAENGKLCMERCAQSMIAQIKEKAGTGKVLLALSGGVDSSVAAALLSSAIGRNLNCIFVDTGLMRKDEGDEVEKAFGGRELNFVRIDAEGRFLSKLAGITDPEAKRKIIGEEFIRVFEEEAGKIGAVDFLAQGTIYPDIIESGLDGAKLVKSHHNVGGMPKNIDFKEIIEPLRLLFKDEVRELGAVLGLPAHLVHRQPFPGPGLAIRVIGEVTKSKLDTLREADYIFRDEVAKAGLEHSINQYFAILTDINSVGVTAGARSYGGIVALRAVVTENFMEADWARLPYDLLNQTAQRITSEVDGVNRVVYDITGKPPGTVEWE